MSTIARIRVGLGLTLVALLAVLAQHNDQAAHAREARIAESRAQMAGRGVCGTGGELARLAEGYACLHTRPDGTMLAVEVSNSPIHLAARP